ncbi:membrane protein, putative [Babesia bigemina]|uniref:Membrane protein, putative n=1 Tax=Babesia bigemina TaxID=5866 RepID=A0A061D8Z7_BABBI|nr:membrane protein, putative [Babesia bigemina]CDR95359.1 membrane protein, putative [Babesia bigemina]|eukprot:XP_012767545.1 membrane protein, putative [Babesia bigemina]
MDCARCVKLFCYAIIIPFLSLKHDFVKCSASEQCLENVLSIENETVGSSNYESVKQLEEYSIRRCPFNRFTEKPSERGDDVIITDNRRMRDVWWIASLPSLGPNVTLLNEIAKDEHTQCDVKGDRNQEHSKCIRSHYRIDLSTYHSLGHEDYGNNRVWNGIFRRAAKTMFPSYIRISGRSAHSTQYEHMAAKLYGYKDFELASIFLFLSEGFRKAIKGKAKIKFMERIVECEIRYRNADLVKKKLTTYNSKHFGRTNKDVPLLPFFIIPKGTFDDLLKDTPPADHNIMDIVYGHKELIKNTAKIEFNALANNLANFMINNAHISVDQIETFYIAELCSCNTAYMLNDLVKSNVRDKTLRYMAIITLLNPNSMNIATTILKIVVIAVAASISAFCTAIHYLIQHTPSQ